MAILRIVFLYGPVDSSKLAPAEAAAIIARALGIGDRANGAAS